MTDCEKKQNTVKIERHRVENPQVAAIQYPKNEHTRGILNESLLNDRREVSN